MVELPIPEPVGGEVLLKTIATGVCHSDVHLHDTKFDLGNGKSLPAGTSGMILGHEIVGQVAALGPDAINIAVGDVRVAYPWIGCDACDICAAGNEHLCDRNRVLGITRPGGFSEYVLVPDSRYLFDKGDADEVLACTYACSGLSAYSALKKVGRLGPRQSLVIIGAGGVGMNAVHIAQAAFGIRPIVVDIDDDKLVAAESAGAKAVVNSTRDNAEKALRELTGGGAHAAIDFVGSESSSRFGQRALQKGGHLVIVGLFGGTFSMPLPMIPLMARTIQGSYVGSLAEMRELMALVRAGKIPAMSIEQRPASAAAATQALDDLRNGRVAGRAVLTF
jgi:D-arabinose 1-dehydrogenase-like Zn-dependent alcohol dehydrogenase